MYGIYAIEAGARCRCFAVSSMIRSQVFSGFMPPFKRKDVEPNWSKTKTFCHFGVTATSCVVLPVGQTQKHPKLKPI